MLNCDDLKMIWEKMQGKGYCHTVGGELMQPFWCVLCNTCHKMCICFDAAIQFVGI